MNPIKIIAASAGTGKTHTMAETILAEIQGKRVAPERIVATTFTVKAAAELRSRLVTRLLAAGLADEAVRLDTAMLGTVHAVCGRLVSEHAFELGLSPAVSVMDERQAMAMLHTAIASAASDEETALLDGLSERMPEFDWVDVVRSIVENARANRIDGHALAVMRDESMAAYLPLVFGTATVPLAGASAKAHDDALRVALATCIASVNTSIDATDTTEKALEIVKDSLRTLDCGNQLPWHRWLKLSRLAGGAKSKLAFGLLNVAAESFESHPLYRQDIEDSIRFAFDLAAVSLTRYADAKRRAGAMDFTDQETLALKLLETPDVKNDLARRIDFVLVDEFQDTSPLQLAIFMALADIAKRSVWVGDQKQSIYGFRGADPSLMDAVIARILGGSEPETLAVSYRSRAPLVELVSKVFTPPFGARGIPESRVAITARRKEDGTLGAPLERWNLGAKNKEEDAQALAAGVMLFLDSKTSISDPSTGSVRPAGPGDIAVLCRKNSECAGVAAALGTFGIPASIPRSGLLSTDLGCVCMAALKLWADNRDGLAAAELARLVDYANDADGWFSATLIKPAEHEEPSVRYAPVALKILDLAQSNPGAGPVEAFDLLCEALDLQARLRRWGAFAERISDLDAFRALVLSYVDPRSAGHAASSVAGLVGWLENLAADNLDARGSGDPYGSVHVVTFHGSKGLEWPVVVVYDPVDAERPKEALGVTVVARVHGFDLDAPLAGRTIRYWPEPFQSANTKGAFYTRLALTPEGIQAAVRSSYENLRLLYVVWTRARDVLILAARAGKLSTGAFRILARETGCLISEPADGIADWAGMQVACEARECPCVIGKHRTLPVESEFVLPEKQARFPATISPSSLIREHSSLEESLELHTQLKLRNHAIDQVLGTALHAALQAMWMRHDPPARLAAARSVLLRWEIADRLDAAALAAGFEKLRTWIEAKVPGCRISAEVPIDLVDGNGSLIRGTVDCIALSEKGFIVLDYKSFPGDFDEAPERQASYAGQLAAYAEAIKAATNVPCLGAWIYFPFAGNVSRLAWN